MSTEAYDVEALRAQFPILQRTVGESGAPLVYLDNTATSQTPGCVVDAIVQGYTARKANVHRGVHTLSQEATDAQEATRRRVRDFIGAESTDEIIFTRGTTEAINLVAASYCRLLNPGDEIVITVMEHHSNIVPWQLAAERYGLSLRAVPLREDSSELDLEAYAAMLGERTRLVAFTAISNVLGTVNPVRRMVDMAHSVGAVVLVDAAQAVAHERISVHEWDADFVAFSAHKMYGPTGVGVLYGRRELLDRMPPYQGGGEMISHVDIARSTWASLPYKFEAGTPDFVGIAALHAAIDWMDSTGIDRIAAHEQTLLARATEAMDSLPGIRIYGRAPGKCAIISFLMGQEASSYDIGMLLDQMGIAVRTGHHCAQPLMHALGVQGVVRASFAAYNTTAEVDAFIAALSRIHRLFGF
ncbi:MAG: cysteine desulfurase [Muribaculaceae bacterium]|nr:cysteine desulfurase [Muribaculaceae bacterium]